MSSLVQQIESLANILTLNPADFRHILLLDEVAKASIGKKYSLFNYSIPTNNGLVVTNVQFMLRDENGNAVLGRNESFAVCQWTASGKPVTESLPAEMQGDIMQVFGDGDNLGLDVVLSKTLPKMECHLVARLSGFLMPSSKTSLLISNSTMNLNRSNKPNTIEVRL